MSPNILILAFNRPDALAKLLEIVARWGCENVFISIDVPKEKELASIKKNIKVKELAYEYSIKHKSCSVYVHETNQGVRLAVSGAITRCFEKVEELIIFEEDCIPLDGCLEYFKWGLQTYRNERKVGSISAQSFLYGRYNPIGEYFYSKYHHCWGWATWKRAWKFYEDDLNAFEELMRIENLSKYSSKDLGFVNFWRWIYVGIKNGKYDSWAFRWLFSCWKNDLISVIPRYSLVENVGFDQYATHTKNEPHKDSLQNYKENWKPAFASNSIKIERDIYAERITSYYHYNSWLHVSNYFFQCLYSIYSIILYVKFKK